MNLRATRCLALVVVAFFGVVVACSKAGASDAQSGSVSTDGPQARGARCLVCHGKCTDESCPAIFGYTDVCDRFVRCSASCNLVKEPRFDQCISCVGKCGANLDCATRCAE